MTELTAALASLDLTLSFIRVTRGCVGGDVQRALVFAAIIDANVGHIEDNPEDSRQAAALDPAYPDQLRRPIRGQRIAESLGLPRQTVRTKVGQLVEMGLVRQEATGFVVPTAALITDDFFHALEAYLAALAVCVERLATAAEAQLQPRERLIDPIWPVSGAAMRIATRHVLRCIGKLRERSGYEALLAEYVMMGALQAMAEVNNPKTSGLALAARLDIPRETVRRQLHILVGRGWLEERSRGVGLSAAFATDPVVQVGLGQIGSDAGRMVRRLRNVGAIVSL